MSLIFYLQENSGGFFCQILKLASNYLYARHNSLHFFVDDSKWLYKHTLGWRDYFTSLNLVRDNKIIPQPIHPEIDVEDYRLHQFTLNEYTEILKEIFHFNEGLQTIYLKERNKLPKNYNSIMIRRGDKMYGEAFYINTDEYIKKLIDIDESDIFVQTDDYTSYEEVCSYLVLVNKSINVHTTCPPNKRGAFVFNYKPDIGSNLSDLNNKYLLNLITTQQKPVNTYSSTEMKYHVEEMLLGLKICIESKYLSTDFQSNVTRFLLCTHNNQSNVLSVGNISRPLNDIKIQCIAKGFI